MPFEGAQVSHDLAVFVLPGTLCADWCNELELIPQPPAIAAAHRQGYARSGIRIFWPG